MMHYNPNGNVPHYVTLSRAALVESGDARMFEQHRYVIARKSMNNLFSYYVLVDVRIDGFEKDLPVLLFITIIRISTSLQCFTLNWNLCWIVL